MPSVIILGGGIAGTAAGIAMHRAGWDVRVLERAERLEAVGAALSLWPNATAALDRLGLLDRVRAAGAPVRAMLVADRRQRPIIPARPVEGLALIVTRADLQRALVEALPPGALTLGREVVETRVAAEGAEVTCRDGRVERADLLVDAGGLRSVAADARGIAYRGYGGVVALSDAVADAGLDGLAAEYWGWGERFGLFELPGGRRYWFYMRDQPADAAPPAHDRILSRASGWAPGIARAVAATPADRLIPFAIHARPAPRRLGAGRLIRVGDAAHAMEPNLGQGACQAIEDAVALGAVARSQRPDTMLAAFERLRLDRVAAIVRRAGEGRFGAHGPVAGQWAMRTLLRLMPASVTGRLARSVQTLPPYPPDA